MPDASDSSHCSSRRIPSGVLCGARGLQATVHGSEDSEADCHVGGTVLCRRVKLVANALSLATGAMASTAPYLSMSDHFGSRVFVQNHNRKLFRSHRPTQRIQICQSAQDTPPELFGQEPQQEHVAIILAASSKHFCRHFDDAVLWQFEFSRNSPLGWACS